MIAALVGTADRSAAETAKTPRLAAFGSCGQLLAYAKSNASRFVGPYGLGWPFPWRDRDDDARRRCRCAQAGRRLLRHERAGGGRRRARHRQDGRQHALRGREREAERGRRQRSEAAPARHARAQRRQTHELLLHGDRLLVLSRGGYWIEPLPAIAARIAPWQPAQSVLSEVNVSDPKRLRLVRTLTLDGSYVVRAARRRQRADRRLGAGAEHAAVRAADGRDAGGARRRDEAATAPSSPRRASGAGCRPTGSSEPERRPGKPHALVQCRHVRRAARILGPRHAHRADGRPDEGARAHRLRRRDDGRPDRLRVAREPLRRDRALGRPAEPGQADGGAERRPHPDPQVRHLEPAADAVPRQRRRLGLPAEPVVALRVQGRAARRQHREPRVVERRPARVRVVPDDAALERRRRSSRPAGSAGSARASASTRCA